MVTLKNQTRPSPILSETRPEDFHEKFPHCLSSLENLHVLTVSLAYDEDLSHPVNEIMIRYESSLRNHRLTSSLGLVNRTLRE